MKMELGEQYWVIMQGRILIVFKCCNAQVEVCGPWECRVCDSEIDEVVAHIPKPESHKFVAPYYKADGDTRKYDIQPRE